MSSAKNLLQMNRGRKAYGSQLLFDGVTFSVNESEHVGVIGPNGAGKSTMFKILIGEEDLDEGELVRSQALKLGYLSQHDDWAPGETGNSFLERTCQIPLWQAKSAGRELQLSEDIYAKPILSLSGGYRMRIKLVSLLGSEPNLMLLDEPTNYLDLETTLLLERFLQNYQGAFLLISHDREILRRTTDHILEIESGEVVKYAGDIDDYFEQKELLRAQTEAQVQNQALKRKAILDFVNRFGAKATKAKQAQSRMKTLQKMEVIEVKSLPVRAAIRIPEPGHVGKTILRLDKACFGYADRKILRDVTLEIRRGDHVAVVGLNGAGKSTLLKGLAGSLAPLSGVRELGFQVELAIFNQHGIEVLNPQHTVYQSLENAAGSVAGPQEIRDMAGSLLFKDHQIEKKVSVLSGGEKSRVALGRILLQKVPCLLLDEPTNHLDFETVEALTQALKNYSGTLIVVSHDRGFIRRVGTKILQVSQGSVLLYPGTYDDYVWSLQQRLSAEDSAPAAEKSESKPAAQPVEKSRQKRKENARELRALEKKLEVCEVSLARLNSENFELNASIAAGGASPAQIQKLADNAVAIEGLEAQWLELAQQRDELFTHK